jgi:hypothetical protein
MSDDCKSPGPVFLRTVIPDTVIRVILQIIRVDTNKNKRVNSDLGRPKQEKKKNSCFIPFPLACLPHTLVLLRNEQYIAGLVWCFLLIVVNRPPVVKLHIRIQFIVNKRSFYVKFLKFKIWVAEMDSRILSQQYALTVKKSMTLVKF